MSMICIGGICIPYSSLLPLLLILLRPLWDSLCRLMGWEQKKKQTKESQQSQQQQEEGKEGGGRGEDETEKNQINQENNQKISQIQREGEGNSSESNCVIFTEKMDWEDVINQQGLVICRFTATWCKPCKAIEPFFYQAATANPNVKFITVDVDDNDELFQSLGILGIPHLRFYVGGVLARSLSGESAKEIQDTINQLQN